MEAEFVSISDILGIDINILSLIMTFLLAIVLHLSVLFWSHSFVLANFAAFTIIAIATFFFHIIPIWILFPIALFLITSFFVMDNPPSEAPEYTDQWQETGNRIKNAYKSKFGYTNPAFNEEVDRHIDVMLHNSCSLTRSMANGWIKRMKMFTDSK